MLLKKQIAQFLTPKITNEDICHKFPLEYFIPVYHAVSDEKLPHLQHIIQYKNTINFENDIDFLTKNFQLLDWEDYKNFVKGNLNPKKKIALLTFDDGLQEFKTVIAPILLRKGIFAINFINPSFIDNQEMMFRNKASLLIETILQVKTIPEKLYQLLNLQHQQKEKLATEILKINFQNREKLDELAKILEVDFKDYLRQKQPYLNIEEIHNLKEQGFGFGAHSMNHVLYHDASIENQLEETIDSLKYLRNNTLPSETFAFPFTDFGVSKSFFEKLFVEEKELFCTFGCAGIKKDSFGKNFQRIPMENGKTMQESLKEEISYYNLKKWLNKNTIVRK